MSRWLWISSACGCGAAVAWLVTRWISNTRPRKIPLGKLRGVSSWVRVDHEALAELSAAILRSIGCDSATARAVADHLVESNLQSIDSHGVVRLRQYTDQARQGLFVPAAIPSARREERGGWLVDGNGGFGITALKAAVEKGIELLKEEGSNGVAAVGVVNCGHTGRLNQFVEQGAKAGALTIVCGGGSRRCWRQVAPYGGAKGLLPTNPWAMGLPGDDRGPVLIDFATSAVAGGWIMAALQAGAELPPGVIVDKDGNPTTDPRDYAAGGALLPAAGPKGFGLALMAELIGGALLGEVQVESGLGLNMLVLMVDTARFLDPAELNENVGSVLEEVRACPAAPGHRAVLVPGQWEREHARVLRGRGVKLPRGIWEGIEELACEQGVLQLPHVEEVSLE